MVASLRRKGETRNALISSRIGGSGFIVVFPIINFTIVVAIITVNLASRYAKAEVISTAEFEER